MVVRMYYKLKHKEIIKIQLVWLLLLIIGASFTVFQIITQIRRHLTFPISTIMDVSYPPVLHFPTFVLCNSNKLRMTHLGRNLQDTVLGFQKGEKAGDFPVGYSMLDFYFNKTGDENSHEIYSEGRHKIEDMLLRCRTPDGPCTADDFTLVNTDNGYCYAMNLDRSFNTTSVGVNSGFNMLINVEAYEKIRKQCAVDFVQTQGLTISIFDQRHIPIMSQSINLPLGFTTDIAVSVTKRKRLDRSGHPCVQEGEEQELVELYDKRKYVYYDTCIQDRIFKALMEKCNCTPYNLPQNEFAKKYTEIKGLKACSMSEQRKCVDVEFQLLVSQPPKSPHKDNDCYPSCVKTDYEVDQTVRDLPDRILPVEIEQDNGDSFFRNCQPSILSLEEWKNITDRYALAEEAKFRFYNEYWKPLLDLLEHLKQATDRLTELMWIPLSDGYKPTYERLLENVTCLNELISSNNSDFSTLLGAGTSSNIPKSQLLEVAGITVPDASKVEEVEKIYLENQEQMLHFEALSTEIHEHLVGAWKPYDEVTYKNTLAENLTSFNRVFELIDSYIHANITMGIYANATVSDEMVEFWTHKYPNEFENVVLTELKENLVAHFAEYVTEDWIGQIINNDTQLKIASTLVLKSAEEKSVEKIKSFLTLLHNCSLGEMSEFGKVLHETFTNATLAFKTSYNRLNDFHKKYLETFKNKAAFIKGNLVLVNIYYSKLAVTKYEQRWAYTFFTLLCDIGGSLGLVIGASILGCVEIIWLAIFGSTDYVEYNPDKNNIMIEVARGNPRGRDRYNWRPPPMSDYRRGGSRGGGSSMRRRPDRTDNRLIVENLSSRVSWQDLKDFFRSVGEVTYADAHGKRKNEGLVEFASRSDMKTALEKMDGKELNGKKIKLAEEKKKSRSRSHSRSRKRSRTSRSHSKEDDEKKEKKKREERSHSATKSRSRTKSPEENGDRSPSPKRERTESEKNNEEDDQTKDNED